MLLEGLSEKLQNSLKKLTGKGKISEKDIKEVMREVKLALLEADVNFKVVKKFVKSVSEKAVGNEVLESLTPGQQVIKIVRDELAALMGSETSKLTFNPNRLTVYMMVGLQGAGKTTNASKLAALLKKNGKKPMLAALDIYRPAAIKQLQILGEQLDIPVFTMGDQVNPVNIAKAAEKEASRLGRDVLILDTAGRLHIDDELMDELVSVKQELKPQEVLLVIDSMTGQDAVNVAETFNSKVGVDGLILTKLDGDTRGGAALSVKEVTGKPIKFIGVGEKISHDALEEFHPDRMASRILGMGDVLSLIEKAQSAFDEKKAKELEEKIKKSELDLDDFLSQLQQMKNMGPLSDILGMIPGMNSKAMKNLNVDEKELARVEAIIQSMTPAEKRDPGILNASRKKRIAAGSGTSVSQVNKLVNQFMQTKKMMKQFSQKGKGRNPFNLKMPF